MKKYTLQNTLTGFTPIIVLLILIFALSVSLPIFLVEKNILNIVSMFSVFGFIAVGIALTSRAKGADFSVIGVMAVSTVICSNLLLIGADMVIAFVVALAVSAVIGFVNAYALKKSNLPSIAITCVVAIILFAISLIFKTENISLGNNVFSFINGYLGKTSIGLVILILVTAGAIVFGCFSKLNVEISKRNNDEFFPSYMISYIVSSVLACFTAFLLMGRISVVTSSIIFNGTYYFYMVFIVAAVYSSTLLDNGFGGIIYAIFASLVWQMLLNMLVIAALPSIYHSIIMLMVTFVCCIITLFWGYKKPFFLQNKLKERT